MIKKTKISHDKYTRDIEGKSQPTAHIKICRVKNMKARLGFGDPSPAKIDHEAILVKPSLV